jgi:hypothetical protein
VFDEGDWASRLNVERRDLGTGMTDAEVDEFNERIDVAALLEYRVAVGRRTREVIGGLQPETLSQVIDAALVQTAREAGVFGPNAAWLADRWQGKLKAFTLTHSILGHSFFHFGQGEVVRAMLGYDVV